MHGVLHAVDHDRGVGAGDVEQPLHPEDVPAVSVEQHGEPDRNRRPFERPVEGDAEAGDVGAVAARVVAGVLVPLGLVEPAADRLALRRGILEVVGEEPAGTRSPRLLDRRCRIEAGEAQAERRQRRLVHDVGFAHRQPVGDRHLFHRFLVAVEGGRAVHRVDDGDDVGEPEVVADHRLGRQRGDDRRRVGQPRGLDHQAAEEGHLPPLAPAVEVADGIGEVAADGAAETAALEQDRGGVDPLQEMVVEPDLAELVDQHGGFPHAAGGEQTAQ